MYLRLHVFISYEMSIFCILLISLVYSNSFNFHTWNITSLLSYLSTLFYCTFLPILLYHNELYSSSVRTNTEWSLLLADYPFPVYCDLFWHNVTILNGLTSNASMSSLFPNCASKFTSAHKPGKWKKKKKVLSVVKVTNELHFSGICESIIQTLQMDFH